MSQAPAESKEGAYLLVIVVLGCLCVGLGVWAVRSHLSIAALEGELKAYRMKGGVIPAPPRRRGFLTDLFRTPPKRAITRRALPPTPTSRRPPPRMPAGFFSSRSRYLRIQVVSHMAPRFGSRHRLRGSWRRRLRQVTLAQWRGIKKWPASFRLNVQNVDFRTVATAADLELSAALPNLRSFIINGATITGTPAGIGTSRLMRLYSVSIQRSSGDLTWLCSPVFQNVRYLNLYAVKGLTAAGALCIAKMKRVSNLRISRSPGFNGKSLKRLASMHRLRSISLQQVGVGDAGLKVLGSFSMLSNVYLSQLPFVTDKGLRHLSSLRMLRHLTIHNIPISGVGFRHLTGAMSLRNISLHHTRMTVAGARQLASLGGLYSLTLSNTGLNDAGAIALGALPSLRRLQLTESLLTNKGMVGIGKLRMLQHLYIVNARIGDRGVAHLRGMFNLNNLTLRGTLVTDRSIWVYQKMRRLRWLNLSRTAVTARGVKRLVYGRRLPFLRYLYVSAMLTHAQKARLRRALPRLRVYDMR